MFEFVHCRTGSNRTEPSRTEPNRTEPNRTEPNRTEPNRTLTWQNQTESNRIEPNRNRNEQSRTEHNQTKPNQTKRIVPTNPICTTCFVRWLLLPPPHRNSLRPKSRFLPLPLWRKFSLPNLLPAGSSGRTRSRRWKWR